jgi:sugar/nucleoside kinase (ribokinase family)
MRSFVTSSNSTTRASAAGSTTGRNGHACGGGWTVVKDGQHGALTHEGTDVVPAPDSRVQAADNTGAEDSFDAGYIAGFLEGPRTPVPALRSETRAARS